jgi:hypothetical protein
VDEAGSALGDGANRVGGSWRVEGETHRGGDERTCFCCCVAPRLATSHGAQEPQGARTVMASTVQTAPALVLVVHVSCTVSVYGVLYKLSRQAKNYCDPACRPLQREKTTTSAWRFFKNRCGFFLGGLRTCDWALRLLHSLAEGPCCPGIFI